VWALIAITALITTVGAVIQALIIITVLRRRRSRLSTALATGHHSVGIHFSDFL
jgi:hypothetical protein